MAKGVDTSPTSKGPDVSNAEDWEWSQVKGRYVDQLSSEERKRFPLASGCMDYFPDALAMVAFVSWVGNEKHNPGQPLHHARGKSPDHADCAVRHLASRDDYDEYEINGEIIRVPHWAQAAWRILAYGQQKMEEQHNLSLPKGAKQYDVHDN